MKNLTEYIQEALYAKVKDNVDQNLFKIVKSAISKVKFTDFIATKENDADRFEKQDANAEMICNAYTGEEYKLLTAKQYYKESTGKDADSLSVSEWAKFDAENGDIIIVDKDNKPVYHIDLKVGKDFYGAVSLASIVRFKKDGYYLCIKLADKSFKLVSHKAVEELAEKGFLHEPNDKQTTTKELEWNGKKLTTTHFVKGLDIYKYVG